MNRRNALALLASLPLSFSFARSHAGQTQEAGWHAVAALPMRAQEIYGAVHNQQLVTAGGLAVTLGVPQFNARCYSYQPEQNQWSRLADLPENLHHAALTSSAGQLYQIGGFNGALSHLWRMRSAAYRLSSQGWVRAVDLPKPQAEGVLSTAEDQAIHLVTGQSPHSQANRSRSDHREVNDHWRWQPGTDKWERAAPIPTARNSASGGWVDGQLVVAGGRTAAGNLKHTEIYHPKEDKWRSAAPMPLAQAGTAAVVSGNKLIVIGGEIFTPEARVFGNVWAYDITTDEWQPLPHLATPRHGLAAGLIDNRIYTVGGAIRPSGSGTSDITEALLLQA